MVPCPGVLSEDSGARRATIQLAFVATSNSRPVPGCLSRQTCSAKEGATIRALPLTAGHFTKGSCQCTMSRWEEGCCSSRVFADVKASQASQQCCLLKRSGITGRSSHVDSSGATWFDHTIPVVATRSNPQKFGQWPAAA